MTLGVHVEPLILRTATPTNLKEELDRFLINCGNLLSYPNADWHDRVAEPDIQRRKILYATNLLDGIHGAAKLHIRDSLKPVKVLQHNLVECRAAKSMERWLNKAEEVGDVLARYYSPRRAVGVLGIKNQIGNIYRQAQSDSFGSQVTSELALPSPYKDGRLNDVGAHLLNLAIRLQSDTPEDKARTSFVNTHRDGVFLLKYREASADISISACAQAVDSLFNEIRSGWQKTYDDHLEAYVWRKEWPYLKDVPPKYLDSVCDVTSMALRWGALASEWRGLKSIGLSNLSRGIETGWLRSDGTKYFDRSRPGEAPRIYAQAGGSSLSWTYAIQNTGRFIQVEESNVFVLSKILGVELT